jgi:hypothetical protein
MTVQVGSSKWQTHSRQDYSRGLQPIQLLPIY